MEYLAKCLSITSLILTLNTYNGYNYNKLMVQNLICIDYRFKYIPTWNSIVRNMKFKIYVLSFKRFKNIKNIIFFHKCSFVDIDFKWFKRNIFINIIWNNECLILSWSLRICIRNLMVRLLGTVYKMYIIYVHIFQF